MSLYYDSTDEFTKGMGLRIHLIFAFGDVRLMVADIVKRIIFIGDLCAERVNGVEDGKRDAMSDHQLFQMSQETFEDNPTWSAVGMKLHTFPSA